MEIKNTVSSEITKEEIFEKLCAAYKILIDKDAHLFTVEANERSMTHKYATYLEKFFEGWDVDCEYNRDGILPKKLVGWKCDTTSVSDLNAVTVYPDIIIHKRDENNNLVVIEAKKSDNKDDNDIEKLKLYLSDLGYRHAYKLEFKVGKDFKRGEIEIFKLIKKVENDA